MVRPTSLLFLSILVAAAAAAPSLSETLAGIADEAYPARLAHCNEIVTNATAYVVDQMRANAANGLDSYLTHFPLEAARCGNNRDQMALITARLCDEENGFLVTCDPANVVVDDGVKYFKFLVEIKRNVGAACNCAAAPLDLPRPPPSAQK